MRDECDELMSTHGTALNTSCNDSTGESLINHEYIYRGKHGSQIDSLTNGVRRATPPNPSIPSRPIRSSTTRMVIRCEPARERSVAWRGVPQQRAIVTPVPNSASYTTDGL